MWVVLALLLGLTLPELVAQIVRAAKGRDPFRPLSDAWQPGRTEGKVRTCHRCKTLAVRSVYAMTTLADIVSRQCYTGDSHETCHKRDCHCPCHMPCTCECSNCRWGKRPWPHEIHHCHIWEDGP